MAASRPPDVPAPPARMPIGGAVTFHVIQGAFKPEGYRLGRLLDLSVHGLGLEVPCCAAEAQGLCEGRRVNLYFRVHDESGDEAASSAASVDPFGRDHGVIHAVGDIERVRAGGEDAMDSHLRLCIRFSFIFEEDRRRIAEMLRDREHALLRTLAADARAGSVQARVPARRTTTASRRRARTPQPV